jgi:molecular chaperone HscB
VANQSSSNAFDLLGLPAKFDLEPQLIEQAYFEKSKELHPDRFASAPAAERVAVLSRSRALNDAYQTLKKPVSRAEYLLERAGITIGDNERLDPEHLMRVLELREELAEATAAKDVAKVTALHAAMVARRDQALSEIELAFAAGALDDAKRALIAMRYISRYLEACDAALDED